MFNRQDKILEIALVALVLTLGFHFFYAGHPFGFGFVIFFALLLVGMVTVALIAQKPVNYWALWFLAPAAFGIIANFLYAAPVTRFLAFILTSGSAAFFAYWFTRPAQKFSEVQYLWPLHFFTDTIWPFGSLKELNELKGHNKFSPVLIGIAIAIPFLLIFLTLFASADALFAKSFAGLFDDLDLAQNVIKFIRDLIAGIYFLAAGLFMVKRLAGEREPFKDFKPMISNFVSLHTFLVLLNLLFATFVAFQAAYFFGGEQFIASQGITYADYARGGFFQLLFAAGLVFLITWVIYRATDARSKITNILNIILILLTDIVIISALRRLYLYIDAYGLTLSRFWAAATITIIAFTLLGCLIGYLGAINYRTAAKYLFISLLSFMGLFLLINSEGLIASYNVNRYLADPSKTIDIMYLIRLSPDAIPTLVALNQASWPDDALLISNIDSLDKTNGAKSTMLRPEYLNLLQILSQKLNSFIANNWLLASISDFKAQASLNTLK